MSTCILTTGAPKRIGFISTRFHGTDGVTLEARKWAHILSGMGHSCFWMAGLLDAPPEVSHTAPLAFFNHPEVADVQSKLFGVAFRTRAVTNQIQSIKERLKDDLYRFIEKFQIEVLVPENILAIPMHVPLGLAMTEVIAETTFPVIAHHHDFAWERERFTLNAVNDYLQAAFPPLLYAMEHVVINSMQQKELARRLGIPSQVIPNVLDFETPPPGLDDYNRDLRREIGLRDDDWFILQPTRVVQRKGIEHAIELVRRLKDPRAKLVISHPAGDEGNAYMAMLNDRIADAGIDVRFIADRVGETRGTNAEGQKGLHAVRRLSPRRPRDLPEPLRRLRQRLPRSRLFRQAGRGEHLCRLCPRHRPARLQDHRDDATRDQGSRRAGPRRAARPGLREDWARTNYALGVKYFSYAVARRKLAARLANLFGEGV